MSERRQSQASTTDQILEVVALATREGLYDAADWFQRWQQANHLHQRFRSLAGDFWHLAHEMLSALGACAEGTKEWNLDQIADENRELAIHLILAVEDYDALNERERAAKAGRG
jgi:hypothetical protein